MKVRKTRGGYQVNRKSGCGYQGSRKSGLCRDKFKIKLTVVKFCAILWQIIMRDRQLRIFLKTPAICLLFVMAVAVAEYKKGCKRVLAALQQLFAFFSVFFRKQGGRLRQTPSLAIRLSV